MEYSNIKTLHKKRYFINKNIPRINIILFKFFIKKECKAILKIQGLNRNMAKDEINEFIETICKIYKCSKEDITIKKICE